VFNVYSSLRNRMESWNLIAPGEVNTPATSNRGNDPAGDSTSLYAEVQAYHDL
jgi:hypothetical protein